MKGRDWNSDRRASGEEREGVLRRELERNLGAGRGGRRWRRMGLGGLQIGVDGKW